MSERTRAATTHGWTAPTGTAPRTVAPQVSPRSRRASVEVLIGRLLWGALFVVVMWLGAN